MVPVGSLSCQSRRLHSRTSGQNVKASQPVDPLAVHTHRRPSMRTITTEDVWNEQWSLLSRFTYRDKITQFLFDRSGQTPDPRVVDFVAGSIRQGEGYLRSAQTSTSLEISPLLIYYGTTSLLFAAVALMKNKRPAGIRHHGLALEFKPDGKLGDQRVKQSRRSTGAFQYLVNNLVDIKHGDENENLEWTLAELFCSIPEIRNGCKAVYSASALHTVPVQSGKVDDLPFDSVQADEMDSLERGPAALFGLADFHTTYLDPQKSGEQWILYKRIDAKPFILSVTTVYGERYFLVPHSKADRRVAMSGISYLLMCSYALGMLSRYYPDFWHPFITSDASGERAVLETFCRNALRVVPNFVLNTLGEEQLLFRPYT